MLKMKYIIGGAVVGGILYTPVLMGKGVGKIVDQVSQNLQTQGVNLKVLSDYNGYLTSQREIEVVIKDGKKFSEFLIQNLDKVSQDKLREMNLDTILTGVKFKGDMLNSNTIPKEIVVNLALKRLSDNAMKELENASKNSKELIMKLLKNNSIALQMKLFPTGKFKSIALKDIDEKILDKKTTAHIVLQGLKLNIANTKNLTGRFVADKILVSALSKRDTVEFNFDDILYKFAIKSQFSSKVDLKISNTTVKYTDKEGLNSFKFGKLLFVNSAKDENEKVMISSYTSVNNFEARTMGGNVNLNNFDVGLTFNNLDSKILQNVVNNFNEMIKQPKKQNEIGDKIGDDIVKLLNKGFSMKLNTSLTKLDIIPLLKVHHFSYDADADIVANKMTKDDFSQKISNFITLDSKFILNKKDKKIISMINPMMATFLLKLAKEKDDNLIFDITYDTKKLQVNGKDIQ